MSMLSRSSVLRVLAALAVWTLLVLPSLASDWPTYRHDARRSAITDEHVAFPMRPAWVYICPQPPRPAWAEPVKNVNRLDFDYAPHPVIAEGIVCFGSSADDTIRALDVETGYPKWEFATGGPVRFAPQIANGKVYGASDDGYVYCLDAATGKPLWTFRGGPYDECMLGNGRMISRWPVRTGVLVDKGVAYFAAGMWPAEGVFLYALDAESGRIIWCNDTSNAGIPRTSHGVYSVSGVNPQGAILASDSILAVPMGRCAPALYDRRTGRFLHYQPGGLANGTGGSWAVIEDDKCYLFAKSFYSPLAIRALSLETFELAPRVPGTIPQISSFFRERQYSLYEGTVSALVRDGKVTARLAWGLAQAGKALIVGTDGAVAAEDTVAKSLAEVRFAVAGNDLALSANVVDCKIAQHSMPWKGSCVEVFGSMPEKGPIGQVFLTPGTADSPAQAFRSNKGEVEPAPEVRLRTSNTEDGYELRALIPLSLLNLDSASGTMTLEFQITAAAVNGELKRNTIFGSELAYQNNQRYGRFQLRTPPSGEKKALPEMRAGGLKNTTEAGADAKGAQQFAAKVNAIDSLDAVKGVLAEQKPYGVTVNVQKEVWRANVRGRAMEIAVAGGRLFVATDEGEITCFVPALEGDKAQTTVHDPAAALRTTTPPQVTGRDAEALRSLKDADMAQGYALVLGDPDGRLSKVLANHTSLHVINALPEAQAAALRKDLLKTTTFYGSRIHVHVVSDLSHLPFVQYFANAVIVADDAPELSGKELYHVLRPYGGVLLFPGLSQARAESLIKEGQVPPEELKKAGGRVCVVRGRLKGGWDWDSRAAGDELVKWPLRLMWFGEPGSAKVYDRKVFDQRLAAANGRFFVIGDNSVTAVDAYNGYEWWSRPLPFAARGRGAVLSADADSVYLTLGKQYFGGQADGCFQLSARTGRQQKLYAPYTSYPPVSLQTPQSWALKVKEQDVEKQAGAVTMAADGEALALTLITDKPAPNTMKDWSLFFDFRPPEERFGLYERGVCQFWVFPAKDEHSPAAWQAGKGSDHPSIEVKGTADGTATVTTVKLPWANLRMPGGKAPDSFGFALTLTVRPGDSTVPSVLLAPIGQSHLFCDEFADGLNNGWANVFLSGIPADSQRAPAVIAGAIESLSQEKRTPRRQQMSEAVRKEQRIHPLTGEKGEKFCTVGEGCGGYACSSTSAITRSGVLSIYDFADDSGRRFFTGVRPSCTGSSMAACGVLFASDGGAGCECSYNFLTSLALAPAERRLNEDWAVFADWRVDTIVRQAALNLGAPGDRRDDQGTLWLGFPRPAMAKRLPEEAGPGGWHNIPGVWQQEIPMAIEVPLEVEVADGFGPCRVSADRVVVSGTDRPWIYTSGYRGIKKATMQLNFLKPLVAGAARAGIKTDGKLDETDWTGEPSAKLSLTKTDLFLRYDPEKLYVAARRPTAVDRLGKVRKWNASVTAKDADVWRGDCLELFLTDARGENSVYFGVGASGARRDALSKAGLQYDPRWDAPWDSAVSADEDAFIVEMAIPWQTLTAVGLSKDTLALNAQINSSWNLGEALVRLGGQGRALCGSFVPLGFDAPSRIPARRYAVRLHFAELDEVNTGERVFDAKLQDKVVLKDFDVVKEAGGRNRALVKEFTGIFASSELVLELVPKAAVISEKTAPILSGIEVFDEEFGAKTSGVRSAGR